jgi:hypothetical protein
MVRSSLPRFRRSRVLSVLLGAASLAAAVTTGLAGPSAASIPAAVAPAAVAPAAVAPAAVAPTPVPVSALTMTGTTTNITVHRVYRRGQVQWINHVLSTRLLGLDGCQGERTKERWTGRTYRTTVRTVCVDGPARAEAAARDLVKDRPWYRIKVARAPLVGFGLLADLPSGNDRAVPAALAELPSGPFTFTDGDDASLNYVGEAVTQAQLDAAVAAFARALGVPVTAVEVTPLAAS